MAARSPLSAEAARRLLAYDRNVFDRFETRIRRLPKAAAFRNLEIGHGSYFGTLVHVLNVADAWVNYIVPRRLPALRRIERETPTARHPTDWRGYGAYAPGVWEGVDAFAASVTPKRLEARVKAPWMPAACTAGDAVLQVSFEEAHHLGEIVGALWQNDRRPPDMTWLDVTRGR